MDTWDQKQCFHETKLRHRQLQPRTLDDAQGYPSESEVFGVWGPRKIVFLNKSPNPEIPRIVNATMFWFKGLEKTLVMPSTKDNNMSCLNDRYWAERNKRVSKDSQLECRFRSELWALNGELSESSRRTEDSSVLVPSMLISSSHTGDQGLVVMIRYSFLWNTVQKTPTSSTVLNPIHLDLDLKPLLTWYHKT